MIQGVKIVRWRRRPNGTILLVVRLDPTLFDPVPGNNCACYVRRFDFPPKPEDVTVAEYKTQMRQEAREQLEQEFQQLPLAAAIPGEGEDL